MPESSNHRLSDTWEGKFHSEAAVVTLLQKKEAVAMEKVRILSQFDYGVLLVKIVEDRLCELR
jgi:hypothetical protein